jgi:hypothetical protein
VNSIAKRSVSATSRFEVDKAAVRAALASRLDELLAAFAVDVREESGGERVGACPVHGGSGRTAFRLYPSGVWRCFSHQCHDRVGGDVLGLIRGLLTARDGKDPGFPGALRWAEGLLGPLPKTVVDAAEAGRFAAAIGKLTAAPRPQLKVFNTRDLIARLTIPSPYFLARGYPGHVLSEFLVGEPKEDSPGPLRGRAIAPLFDPLGQVVGFSGRYRGHPPDGIPKWLHQPKGLLRNDLMYGWDSAEEAIRDSCSVVLVEGCPDVWAWRAHGVRNVVGLCGVALSDAQQVLLERSGAEEILLAHDADPAGDEAAVELTARLAPIFRVRRLRPPAKDWGDAFEQGLSWDTQLLGGK